MGADAGGRWGAQRAHCPALAPGIEGAAGRPILRRVTLPSPLDAAAMPVTPASAPGFAPDRAAGLARLAGFVPRAGQAYAGNRNLDPGGAGHVSALSPWIRHRIVTEEEVIAAVLAAHGRTEAGKFMSEVLWRSYWKGFLEMRPALWSGYREGLRRGLDRLATEAGLRRVWEDACEGRTGISGFDDWARQLRATGWLHNHARMSFASIWVFTLRLPWELGADFFLRHLLDGDAASNTLSWRWVAGLHTPGKTYLATAAIIGRTSGGRFRPEGLAEGAAPVAGMANPAPGPCPAGDDLRPGARSVLLVHEDDLSPGFVLDEGLRPRATAFLLAPEGRSPLAVAPGIGAFVRGAMADLAAREAGRLGDILPPQEGPDAVARLVDWARAAGAGAVVTPYAPVGPAAQVLARLDRALAGHGIALVRRMRARDARLWPLATQGFFRFREVAGPV